MSFVGLGVKIGAIFHQHRVLNIDLLHYMQSHCDDSDTRRDTNQIIEMLSPLDT